MTIHLSWHWQPEYILAVVAGIAILLQPKLLNYIVAIYLIIVGILGLTGLTIVF